MSKSTSNRSILWRSWVALSAIIAIVLAVLSVLIILQHNAILANLIQSRLSVIAQSTSASFRPIVNLGLPLSTVRNASDILDRAQMLDLAVQDIHVFNPTGIIVHSTAKPEIRKVSDEVLQKFSLSDDDRWQTETELEFGSGITIHDSSGNSVGAIVVVSAKDSFVAKTDTISIRILSVAMILFLALSVLTLVILRLRLNGALRGLGRISALMQILSDGQEKIAEPRSPDRQTGPAYGFFSVAIDELQDKLLKAQRQYHEASGQLSSLAGNLETPQQMADPSQADQSQDDSSQASLVVSVSETPLARVFTRQLTPWVAALVISAVLLLGYFAYSEIGESFAPELAARTQLIGTVANSNIQRAVNSGVPLEKLVGAEQFFDDLLQHFPEISYFGISTGRIILEAGSREKSQFAPARSHKDVPTFPITHEGEQIGYIIIDANPGYFALQFRDVLLDLGVVLLVVVLFAYEIMVVMISLSLTSPFNRLQYLADQQALGDFSIALRNRGRNVVDRLGQVLSQRAQALHNLFARASSATSASNIDRNRLLQVRERFKLLQWRPRLLQFSYLNDIRLPLFLFAAADELPISFLPVYTRSVENPLIWLDQGIVLSLPLAGYLLAIVLVSPFARPLAESMGHRKLLLLAIVPTVVAHLGLYAASTTIEIIVFRTLVGMGFAVATLVCQDYVLDVASKKQRNSSLGLFTAAMFGGVFAGTAIGGILADRLGPSLVFAISAGLVALAGILILKMMPTRESRVADTQAVVELKPSFPPIWQPLRSLRFASLVFGIAIPANVLLQAFISYLVALQLDALGASAADIGRVLMTYFLALALIGPMAPRLFESRFHPTQVCLFGALLSGLALATAAFWPSYWTMLLAVVGAGVGHSLVRDPQVAIAMEIAENQLSHIGVNPVLGSLRTLERAGSIVGLIGLALLSSYAGYSVAIGTVSAWVMVGALVFSLQVFSGTRLTNT
ncbi:MFS transporter [Gammaproteobacteria bacterium]|nr:MFS transporter [Gammaproteobacteria bacterium]